MRVLTAVATFSDDVYSYKHYIVCLHQWVAMCGYVMLGQQLKPMCHWPMKFPRNRWYALDISSVQSFSALLESTRRYSNNVAEADTLVVRVYRCPITQDSASEYVRACFSCSYKSNLIGLCINCKGRQNLKLRNFMTKYIMSMIFIQAYVSGWSHNSTLEQLPWNYASISLYCWDIAKLAYQCTVWAKSFVWGDQWWGGGLKWKGSDFNQEKRFLHFFFNTLVDFFDASFCTNSFINFRNGVKVKHQKECIEVFFAFFLLLILFSDTLCFPSPFISIYIHETRLDSHTVNFIFFH